MAHINGSWCIRISHQHQIKNTHTRKYTRARVLWSFRACHTHTNTQCVPTFSQPEGSKWGDRNHMRQIDITCVRSTSHQHAHTQTNTQYTHTHKQTHNTHIRAHTQTNTQYTHTRTCTHKNTNTHTRMRALLRTIKIGSHGDPRGTKVMHRHTDRHTQTHTRTQIHAHKYTRTHTCTHAHLRDIEIGSHGVPRSTQVAHTPSHTQTNTQHTYTHTYTHKKTHARTRTHLRKIKIGSHGVPRGTEVGQGVRLSIVRKPNLNLIKGILLILAFGVHVSSWRIHLELETRKMSVDCLHWCVCCNVLCNIECIV